MSTSPFFATDPARKNLLADCDWSLCVGAGICRGIMPDWATVTKQMLSRAKRDSITADDLTALAKELGWSLDSFLQYSLNLYLQNGRSLDDFNSDLASELYGTLLSESAKFGLQDLLAKLLSDPFSRDDAHILDLESFLSKSHPQSSVMQIGRSLLRVKNTPAAPASILTFNADVLLHVALTLLQIREYHTATGKFSPDFAYRGIHRSTDRPNGKVPIFHIHGSITPTQGRREARDKLIFPESSYSQLAGSIYSWPQTVFLSTAQSSRMVFIGLSMSDPNIRRWLSWCDEYRRTEIGQFEKAPQFSSQHFWITTLSKNPHEQQAKEIGLLHLGVRTVFINSWNELESGLSNLMGF